MLRLFQLILLATVLTGCETASPRFEPAPLPAGQVSEYQEIDLVENLSLKLLQDPATDPATVLPGGLDAQQRARIIHAARRKVGLQ